MYLIVFVVTLWIALHCFLVLITTTIIINNSSHHAQQFRSSFIYNTVLKRSTVLQMKYYVTIWGYHFSQKTHFCLFSIFLTICLNDRRGVAVQEKFQLSGKDTEVCFCNKTTVQSKFQLSERFYNETMTWIKIPTNQKRRKRFNKQK